MDDDKVKENIIIPVSAIRDEGTSYHYIAPSVEIETDEHSIQVLENVLKSCGYSYVKGKTWTSDAIYRETIPAINERRQDGCLVVEMECASMLAVSQYRRIPFIQFLYGRIISALTSGKSGIWNYMDLRMLKNICFWLLSVVYLCNCNCLRKIRFLRSCMDGKI